MSAKIELTGERVGPIVETGRYVRFEMVQEGTAVPPSGLPASRRVTCSVFISTAAARQVQLSRRPAHTKWWVRGEIALHLAPDECPGEVGLIALEIRPLSERDRPDPPDADADRRGRGQDKPAGQGIRPGSVVKPLTRLAPWQVSQLIILGVTGVLLMLTLQPGTLHRTEETAQGPITYSSGFTDVPDSNPYAKYIASLREHQVTVGNSDGSFQPEEAISRAELAAFLVKAFRLPLSQNPTHFADSRGHWGAASIQTAYEVRLLAGISETEFQPDEAVYREQAAIMVWNYLKQHGVQPAGYEVPLKGPTSPWAREAVKNIVYYDLYGPNEVTIDSQDYRSRERMTRQQAAVLVDKAMKMLP